MKGEERIGNVAPMGAPAIGRLIEVKESHSSPPAVSVTTYRVTRVDADGSVWGVQVDYWFEEFSGEDMR